MILSIYYKKIEQIGFLHLIKERKMSENTTLTVAKAAKAVEDFLKQQKSTLSYNAMGKRLFNMKLDKFLEVLQCDNKQSGIIEVSQPIIDAVINHADSKTILRAFKLLKDDRLLDAVLSCVPYRLCLPQDRYSPENFLIKASDKEIEPEMLQDMEKKNEEETAWLKLKLVPALHPNSTFCLNKPMVFYVPKKEDDYLFNGCDLRDNKDIVEESADYEIRRVVIVVENELDLFQTEKLVRLRMSKNVQVRLCLLSTAVAKKDHTLQTEFIEWLSTKLEIPLIK